MADDDLIYLLRRATEERSRATEAIDDSVRAAHLGLAEAYDSKILDADKPASSSRARLTIRMG